MIQLMCPHFFGSFVVLCLLCYMLHEL
ncbi:hypothetical protein ACMD2_09061 [Ananas comosus]|uniref:Uncharacterized protein n=1 Tax=Ananas comosus TaxID=4615 RepID=A0A199VTT8_ANACO|nr:hypothetical protein ACMD2_09061 [Ananas comosus]